MLSPLSHLLFLTLLSISSDAFVAPPHPSPTFPSPPIITPAPIKRCKQGESCQTLGGGATTIQPQYITVQSTVEVDCTVTTTIISSQTLVQTLWNTQVVTQTVSEEDSNTITVVVIHPTPTVASSLYTTTKVFEFTTVETDTSFYATTLDTETLTSTIGWESSQNIVYPGQPAPTQPATSTPCLTSTAANSPSWSVSWPTGTSTDSSSPTEGFSTSSGTVWIHSSASSASSNDWLTQSSNNPIFPTNTNFNLSSTTSTSSMNGTGTITSPGSATPGTTSSGNGNIFPGTTTHIPLGSSGERAAELGLELLSGSGLIMLAFVAVL